MVSHLDNDLLKEKIQEACEKYLNQNKEKEKCKILIDGSTYCPPVKNLRIPEYCYKDASLDKYLLNHRNNYKDYFIERALYHDNILFSVSNKLIKANKIDSALKLE